MSATDETLFSRILVAREIAQKAQADFESAESSAAAATKAAEVAKNAAAARRADLDALIASLVAAS